MQVQWSSFITPYDEQKVKLNAPESAGVYLIWVKLQNGNWRCFYVGKAENLKERLLDHLSTSESNTCVKTNTGKFVCGFEYALVARKDDRSGIEKYLYDHYKPECNQVDPGGDPISINLP